MEFSGKIKEITYKPFKSDHMRLYVRLWITLPTDLAEQGSLRYYVNSILDAPMEISYSNLNMPGIVASYDGILSSASPESGEILFLSGGEEEQRLLLTFVHASPQPELTKQVCMLSQEIESELRIDVVPNSPQLRMFGGDSDSDYTDEYEEI